MRTDHTLLKMSGVTKHDVVCILPLASLERFPDRSMGIWMGLVKLGKAPPPSFEKQGPLEIWEQCVPFKTGFFISWEVGEKS